MIDAQTVIIIGNIVLPAVGAMIVLKLLFPQLD